MNTIISLEDAAKDLSKTLDKYDWFVDVNVQDNYIVASVDYMNNDVFGAIPTKLYGYDVKIWFKQYLFAKETFNTPLEIDLGAPKEDDEIERH